MNVKKLKLQGVINARFDAYAALLDSGWVQEMIVEELRKEGYVLSTKYFSHCYSKARTRKNDRASEAKNHGQTAQSLAKKNPELDAGVSDEEKFYKGTGNREELI